jgi:beta-lactamase regulating signal transducer with metallopeptidase domain
MPVLLNWLMQGVLVAMAAAAALRLLPASPARARYRFIWAAYLLVLALPALQLVWTAPIDVPAVELSSIPVDSVFTVPAAWWTSPAAVMSLLIAWSGVHVVQLVAGAVALRRARRHGRPCPRDVLTRLPHWSYVHATGRPTRVVLSTQVRFAAVLGCGSPIIALAPGLIDQLGAADLDRVLIHEWAHVQRRDDVMQVVQRIVRAIVGWHPAAWWLERQLEFEREMACDEVAVAVTGSTKAYAACLATLAALPQAPIRSLPVLAVVSPSGLRRRFVRILALPSVGAARPSRAATIGAVVTLAAVALLGANVRAVASAPVWTPLPLAARPSVVDVSAIGVSTASGSVVRAASRGSQISSPPPRSNRRARSAERERDVLPGGPAVRTIEQPPTMKMPFAPLHATEWTASAPLSTPLATPTQPPPALDSAPLTDTPRQADEKAPAPWAVAANVGVAIGRTSQNAGVATAGFFTRLGKKIAHSF